MATKSSNYSSPPSLFSSPLTIEQLNDVDDLLERCGFPQARWHELGLKLGLHKYTLDVLGAVFSRDIPQCLTECLSKWLRRADNVDSKGGATFDSLSDALKSMNENAAADKLDQEKRNAMISGNDIKGTNDVHSTATGPAPPIALMDIPDDRPKVSELVEFHELLIKGQLEESLPLLDADTIRKIRNAASDHEGMSLLRKAFEEHPTLLYEMRVHHKRCLIVVPPQAPKPSQSQDSSSAPHDPTATVLQDKEGKKDASSFKPMEGSMSPEYIIMKEMLADLVDLLAGNAPVISQLNNHLFSSDLIPKAVHVTVGTTGLTPYDRANKIFPSVLATLECHPNPNSVFSSLITSLQKVGLKNMASKLMENLLKMKGSYVDPNPEQKPSVSKGPLQPVDVTAQSHTPQPTITGSQSSTPTTVIELSSKSEVAANMKSLHSRFASLNVKMRGEIVKIVQKGEVELIDIARSAAAYLSIEVSSLKYGNVDELFDSLQPHYDFFNCDGVLKHLTDTYLSNAQTELTQYIDSVDEFSESSQLKHIRSVIDKEVRLLDLSTTKPIVIKLNGRWDEMTIKNFKSVLQYYFEPEIENLFSHISIKKGSVIITLLMPTSLSQSLIDAINNKTNSISRLGILEVAVDNKVIPIRRKDDNNFDVSLHESVKAGNSFEVSMLLQLGADPNSKDERGKSAVEIAKQGGHTQIKEILLTAGGEETGKVKWTSYKVSLTKPSAGQCQEVISQLTDSHQYIHLHHSSPDIVYLLMSLVLNIRTIKWISIFNAKITKDVILFLSHKITNNTSLDVLWISDDSINDDGVIALTQSLINNKTIIKLLLNHNPDITSTSAQSLAELLLYNHTLSVLSLDGTNIDTDGVLVLMESLRTNNTLRRLWLDNKHKQTCSSLPYYKTIENRLDFA
uniref:Death domain-containing protein n=1 Tax=Amphimedon queenslandica TaxID=400682 RepID=A0A1X7TA31_AMPQE